MQESRNPVAGGLGKPWPILKEKNFLKLSLAWGGGGDRSFSHVLQGGMKKRLIIAQQTSMWCPRPNRLKFGVSW